MLTVGITSSATLRLQRDNDAVIGFRFGEDGHRGRLTADGFDIVRADPDGAGLLFEGQPAALMAAVHGVVPFETLQAAGALTVVGDRKLAQRFTKLFPLSQKVPKIKGAWRRMPRHSKLGS